MKRAGKLLSLLLSAALLCSLLPGAGFAPSGAETDPIPLTLGETLQRPDRDDVFYSFTPEEDGVYSVVIEALFGVGLEPVEESAALSDNGGRGLSGYLYGGETYVLRGAGNAGWIQVVQGAGFTAKCLMTNTWYGTLTRRWGP